jgi:glycosyltransferase involved in cell wall biosynthesis
MISPAEPSRPARVALYLPNLEGGGAERMMVALANGLCKRGVRVEVVLARAYGPFITELPPAARLVDLRSRGVLASLPRLVAYLRRTRPDAALATLPHASIALVWAATLARVGTRVFIRVPTTPSAVRPSIAQIRRRVMPWLMRRYYPLADGVVAVSHGVAEDLHRFLRLPPSRTVTIYNPVVTPELLDKAREPLADPWFEERCPPVILSVGRLEPEKDFPTLIRAFARVLEVRPARLIILGEGSERRNLERLVDELGLRGKVRLPGFVGNPFPYMAAASAYLLSSNREGLPGALIQAMACGCPIVSTDCPSGPNEVLDGGRFGKLVPVGDAPRMAEAIVDTLDEPIDRSALQRRSLLYSEQRSVDAYLELMLGVRHAGGATATSS